MEPEQCFGDLGSRIIKEMKNSSLTRREREQGKEERSSLQAACRLKQSRGERGKRLRAFDVEIGQFETVNFNFSSSTETPLCVHLLSLKNVLFFPSPPLFVCPPQRSSTSLSFQFFHMLSLAFVCLFCVSSAKCLLPSFITVSSS